jgi:hypothetical protein
MVAQYIKTSRDALPKAPREGQRQLRDLVKRVRDGLGMSSADFDKLIEAKRGKRSERWVEARLLARYDLTARDALLLYEVVNEVAIGARRIPGELSAYEPNVGRFFSDNVDWLMPAQSTRVPAAHVNDEDLGVFAGALVDAIAKKPGLGIDGQKGLKVEEAIKAHFVANNRGEQMSSVLASRLGIILGNWIRDKVSELPKLDDDPHVQAAALRTALSDIEREVPFVVLDALVPGEKQNQYDLLRKQQVRKSISERDRLFTGIRQRSGDGE